MKKSLHITVALLLLFATTGVSITKHYCHGALVNTSLFGKVKSCCDSSCGECRNEISFNKVNENFVSSSFEVEKVKTHNLLFPIVFVLQLNNCLTINELPVAFIQYKAPPPFLDFSITPEYLSVFRC